MKVTFRTTAAQQLMALAIKAKVANEVADQAKSHEVNPGFLNGKPVPCGNLAWVEDTGYGVRQQDLTLHDDGTITYEGGRTTLDTGCGHVLETIVDIFGSLDTATKQIISIETTIDYPNLKWYETEEVAVLKGIVPFDRLLELAKRHHNCGYAARNKITSMLPYDYLNMSLAKRSASFTNKELNSFNRIEQVLKQAE